MKQEMTDIYRVNVMRAFMFIFVLVYMVTGIIAIVTGAVISHKLKTENYFSDPTMPGLSNTLIISGTMVLATAPLGYYGASKKSIVFLIIFAGCITSISIIEIAVAGIGIAAYRGEDLIQRMDAFQTLYYKSEDHKRTWDSVHQKFACCGTFGQVSWGRNPTPLSCCHSNEDIGKNIVRYCTKRKAGKYGYVDGCTNKMRDLAKAYLGVLLGIGIGVAFLKVSGIFSACFLANSMRKLKKRENRGNADSRSKAT